MPIKFELIVGINRINTAALPARLCTKPTANDFGRIKGNNPSKTP